MVQFDVCVSKHTLLEGPGAGGAQGVKHRGRGTFVIYESSVRILYNNCSNVAKQMLCVPNLVSLIFC